MERPYPKFMQECGISGRAQFNELVKQQHDFQRKLAAVEELPAKTVQSQPAPRRGIQDGSFRCPIFVNADFRYTDKDRTFILPPDGPDEAEYSSDINSIIESDESDESDESNESDEGDESHESDEGDESDEGEDGSEAAIREEYEEEEEEEEGPGSDTDWLPDGDEIMYDADDDVTDSADCESIDTPMNDLVPSVPDKNAIVD